MWIIAFGLLFNNLDAPPPKPPFVERLAFWKQPLARVHRQVTIMQPEVCVIDMWILVDVVDPLCFE
jgi:hypothetical protein